MAESEQEYKKKLRFDRMIYYFVMFGTIALIVFSIWYAYVSANLMERPILKSPSMPYDAEGKTKPLPDFIIDNITPDEMEQLKP